MEEKYLEYFRKLSNELREIRASFEKVSGLYEHPTTPYPQFGYFGSRSEEEKIKLAVDSVCYSLENAVYMSEEILSSLREDTRSRGLSKRKKIPKWLKRIMGKYVKSLEGLRISMDFVISDARFQSYTSEEKRKEIMRKFLDLEKESKKFLAELAERNETLYLLK